MLRLVTVLITALLPLAAPTGSAGAAEPPTCHRRPATLVLGADAPAHAHGTDGPDVVVIEPDAPVTSFDAGPGDDTVCVLTSSHDFQRIRGDDGDDRISAAGATSDRPGAHHLLLDGGRGDDVVIGSSQGDSLLGGAGDDVLDGGGGDDRLVGNGGRDVANGGRGRDRCRAETTSSC